MNVPRKQISDAVFGVFKSVNLSTVPNIGAGVTTWKSASKDVDIWTNIDAFDQPYCGLICPEDVGDDPQAFGLTKWVRRYYGLIYFRRDATPLPEGSYFQDTIDGVLDAIDAAFAAPIKGEANTLGGIVADCMIQGTIYVDPGTLDQQCAIVIPISVITGI